VQDTLCLSVTTPPLRATFRKAYPIQPNGRPVSKEGKEQTSRRVCNKKQREVRFNYGNRQDTLESIPPKSTPL